ncbi:lipopolysaccharide assembly protein LapB [Ferrovum sp. PN-J185]|uniref:lipopolysaccharide assembly protein LapB n=1 Tax=Ferrovum sp. PN-J185 TaxID=1356306 RepID=UPI00079B868C|nr:lipopolysaccharide assembly protein LapB [Ferrovum sp. PN-J185]KXW56868.1 lipopolysaccharide regulatory protein [Ferrovum sp. PN-J185]MCC6069264.1 lipopolysaccharide assembly protein LapB [Ferrovum sp. PN-J185]
MDFQAYWLLVIPVFFGLGWLAARVDIRHLLTESRALPASYFKGLNFLLNEQTDKAIESFIEVAQTDQQTVELQFALGGLFRRRGEVDRATRMHQSLLERTDLSAEQKSQALYELAQDYLKAGLLDRAESLFLDLKKVISFSEVATRSLLDIYVTEKEWNKAIEITKELESIGTEIGSKEIANFYCELAVIEHSRSNFDAAKDLTQKALTVNKKCVRANILQGQWARQNGQLDEAVHLWLLIENQSPDYLFLIADSFIDTMKQLNRTDESIQLLRGWTERFPTLDLLSVLFKTILECRGPEAAYQVIKDEFKRNPSLGSLDKYLEAQLVVVSPEQRSDLQMIRDLVHQHNQKTSYYQCTSCGFKAKTYFWHCPACGGWDTYPPKRNSDSGNQVQPRLSM